MGVRSNEDEPNVFDDKFYVFDHKEFLQVLTGTTNCGTYYLNGGYKRYNKHGAFVLKSETWHKNMWKYTYRSTRGHELRQVHSVAGFRDGDNDNKSEQIGNEVFGLYGINFHTTTFKWYNEIVKKLIGYHSAGCQVTNERDKFYGLMMAIKARINTTDQKYITYCLIDEFVP